MADDPSVQDHRAIRWERREEAAVRQQLKVVDAVVRGRVEDPDRQNEIIAAARDRLAHWLARGAQIEALDIGGLHARRSERKLER